ncbi:hypothetical protein D1007_02697 [Hordeum vulgare]|nr:hypothetical protein D1007_02697 [Hordeum vulgare]
MEIEKKITLSTTTSSPAVPYHQSSPRPTPSAPAPTRLACLRHPGSNRFSRASEPVSPCLALPRYRMSEPASPLLLACPSRRVLDDQIPNRYRWLEDPDSEDAKGFMAAQVEPAEFVPACCADRYVTP